MERNESLRKDITEGPIVKTIFRLGWPIMVSSLLHYFYNITDTFWVGRLPKAESGIAVAGLQLSGPVIWFLISFAFGFMGGGLALISQYTGAKDHKNANFAASQVLSMTIIFGIPIAILGYVASGIGLPLLTHAKEISNAAILYTRIIFVGVPLIFISAMFSQSLAAYGDTVTPMVITGISVILNIILDPFLIFGLGPFPKMGIQGAAIATVFSQALAALSSLYILFAGKKGLKIKFFDLKPLKEWYFKIAKIGLPSALGWSSTSFGFVVLTGIVGRVQNAEIAIAAYGIGDRLINLIFIVCDGLGIGISTIVGQSLGKNLKDRAQKAVLQGILVIFAILAIEAILLYVARRGLFALFIPNRPDIAEEGALFLSLFLTGIPFFGIISGAQAAFSGSGHNMPSMVMQITRLWVLRVPLSYIFAFTLNMGSRGIWIAMAISNVIAGILALILIFTVNWKKKVIEEHIVPELIKEAGEAEA